MKSVAKYSVLLIGVIAAINFFAQLNLEKVIALNPAHLINFTEFWRLILYPIIEPSLTSFLFFAIAFLIFAPALEQYFNKVLFYTLLITLVPLTSCIETLIFWGKDINFYGTDVLTAFVFGLSIFIYPKHNLKIIHLKSLNNYKAVAVIFAIWIAIGIENSINSDINNYFAYIFPILFGFLAAASIKLQMNFFFKYYFQRKQARSYTELKNIANEVVREKRRERDLEDYPELHKLSREDNQAENNLKVSENLEENEEILNLILDKINTEGFSSLTPEEKAFLDEFSKIL